MKPVIQLTKQLFHFAGWLLPAILIGMSIISLFEGAALYVLISTITSSSVPIGLLESNGISGMFKVVPAEHVLSAVLAVYVLLTAAQAGLHRFLAVRNVRIQTEFVRALRNATYTAMLQANWSFFIGKRKSDLINMLTSEMNRIFLSVKLCVNLISSCMFTVVQIGLAFLISPEITSVVLLFGLLLSFFSRVFIRRARMLGKQTTDLAENYMSNIHDQVNGIKDIKSNRLEFSHIKQFSHFTEKLVEEQVGYEKLYSSSQFFYRLVAAVLIACLIFVSGHLLHVEAEQFLFVIVVFSRLWPRFMNIQSSAEQISAAAPVFQALMDLQAECKKAADIPDEGKVILALQKGIECREVCFRYHPNEFYTLKKINMMIPANQMTAIVGPSGSGKSTLIDLLMGLLEPAKGQVFLDGKPLESSRSALRHSLGYVPQEPFLFNGTIKENLHLVKPEATDEELWEALAFSSASLFVDKLPKKLDTEIGDRGLKLSGGERQRLVLARAILRKPAVLVLDEATSALDSENELKIQNALEKLKGRMTIVVIAHRLSTIQHADQVIVLDEGHVVQAGRFQQLAKEKGRTFSRLLGSQVKAKG